MKPLHASFKRLSCCPCCQTIYSKKNAGKRNDGKSSARHRAKLEIKKSVAQLND